MKKIIIVAFFVIALTFLVAAQEIETTSTDDAGTTPDSAVWGIDRAIERIELALTLGSANKERKRLENAHERLLEVKKMIEEGKLDDARKAKEKHAEILEISKKRISEISTDDNSNLEDIADLEDSVEALENQINDLDIEIKIRGSLTEEQKKLLEDFISSLGGNIDEVKIVIKNKENEALEKIEERTGKSKVEIVDELGRLREKKIVRAEVFDGYSIIKVGYRFTTRTTDRGALINEIIERFAISESEVANLLKIESSESNESDRDRFVARIKIREEKDEGISEVELILRKRVDATTEEDLMSSVVDVTKITKEQLLQALQIHRDKNQTDRDENEREIEIETKTRDGIAFTKVEIEWDGIEKEIILQTADMDEIVERISILLNVSTQEVRDAITKSENEDDDKILRYVAKGGDCDRIKYICERGFESFRNDIGCGCKTISDDSEDEEEDD